MKSEFEIQMRLTLKRSLPIAGIFSALCIWTMFISAIFGLHISVFFKSLPNYLALVVSTLFAIAQIQNLEDEEFLQVMTRANLILSLAGFILGNIRMMAHLTEGVERLASLVGTNLFMIYFGVLLHLSFYLTRTIWRKRKSDSEENQIARKSKRFFYTCVIVTSFLGSSLLIMFLYISIERTFELGSQAYLESTERFKKVRALDDVIAAHAKAEVDEVIQNSCKDLSYEERSKITEKVRQEEFKKAGLAN